MEECTELIDASMAELKQLQLLGLQLALDIEQQIKKNIKKSRRGKRKPK